MGQIEIQDIHDREYLRVIIETVLNGSYEKKIKNIVGYIQKNIKDLDSNEKIQITQIIRFILNEMIAEGKVRKGEKGYILWKYK